MLSPTQKITANEPSHAAPAEIQNFKMYIRLPRRDEPRAGMKAQFGEDVSPKNVVNHSRTKTRWDSTSGKRIPVSIPDTVQNYLKEGPIDGEGTISEGNKRNVSEELCSTLLE